MPFINIPSYGAASWKEAVANVVDLPASGNSVGDTRVVEATSEIYIWDGTIWNLASGSGGAGITDLTNDVTATGPGSAVATVAFVGGETAADVATSVQDTQAATDLSTVSTLVKRDASGETSLDGLNLDGLTSGVFSLKAADTTTSYTVKMPNAQGGTSTVLQNDGSGNLSWATISVSGLANDTLSNLVSPTAINQNLNLGSNAISQTNYIISPQLYDAGTQTTNFTLDWSNGPAQKLVINAAGPLVITLSNPVTGGLYILRIEQGATPGTVTWPASVEWGDSGAPSLSTTTGDVDVFSLFYDGTNYYASAQIEDAIPPANRALTNLSFSGSNGQYLTLSAGVPAWGSLPFFANTSLSNLVAPTAINVQLLAPLGSTAAPTYSFTGDTDTGFWSPGAGQLGLTTNQGERVRINNVGDVGIGTTSPAVKLHLRKDTGLTNTVENMLRIELQTNGTPAAGLGLGIQISTETTPNNVEIGVVLEAVTTDVTATSEDFDLVIKTMTNGAAATEKMRVASTGVIINETGADQDTRIEGDTDANLVFVDAGADRVGIGTATPAEKLEVSGNVKVSSGDVSIATAGKGLKVATGTNAKMGTAAFANVASVTVNTTAVSTGSLIFVTQQDGGNQFGVDNIVNGTSFDIEHAGGNITATVAWIIIDPA